MTDEELDLKDDLKDEEDLPRYEDFPLLPLPLAELLCGSNGLEDTT